MLSGKLEFPASQRPLAFAIFAHCFTCSKNLNAVRNISRGLNQNGIAVLRFDFTGLGGSEGEFSDTNFSSNIDDLVNAANFLREEYKAPQLIIGHSLGGAAVLRAVSKISSIQAVATIGAPFDPSHVRKLFDEGIDGINKKGEATISIGGRPFKIKKQFIDDLEKYDCSKEIKNLRGALMILHSPQDNTVGIENAGKIYDAAMHPKSFVSLDGADHLLTNESDSIYAGEIISSWAKRYLDLKSEELKPQNQVTVRTGKEGLYTEIAAGLHHLIADEPESVGGTELGPTPYDFLLTALGTCKSMTLRLYADRKKWPVDEILVHLSHDKAYRDDCEDCENKGARIDQIERKIELVGNLDADQRQRLLEIADKCPVHRTLHSEISVVTQMV